MQVEFRSHFLGGKGASYGPGNTVTISVSENKSIFLFYLQIIVHICPTLIYVFQEVLCALNFDIWPYYYSLLYSAFLTTLGDLFKMPSSSLCNMTFS
jgi:hypothetical protein